MNEPLILRSLDAHGNGLELRFHWNGDRFLHIIDYLFRGERHRLTESVESNAEVAWPASPPLQQLSIEPIEGLNVALGVGSAGKGHWSMSVSPDFIADPSRQQPEPFNIPAFKFDWALRSESVDGWIGSTYQANSPLAQFKVVEKIGRTNIHLPIAGANSPIAIQAEIVPGRTQRWAYWIYAAATAEASSLNT